MKCHLHPDRDAVGYCVSCGRGVCAECRREVAGTVRCPDHATQIAPAPALKEKSGFLTVIFSFLPGLGHVYLGAYQRGITIGLIFAGLCVINSHGAGPMEPLFGIATAFVWFFAIFDAHRICSAINRGQAPSTAVAGVAPVPVPRPSSRAGSLTWGIILFGIGALMLADRYWDMEAFFEFVGDNIGWVFLVLGAVLLGAYTRKRARERDEAAAASDAASASSPSSSSLLK